MDASGLPQSAIRIYDLDTREITGVVVPNDGTIDLGETDHDMAIVIKRH